MTSMPADEAMIYLDNAATSFPKPDAVIRAVQEHLTHLSANPGRSGHRLSAAAARVVFETRERLAHLLGACDSRHVLFTANATASLNLALTGFLRAGDHVVTSSLEHNSVMRPLRRLREQRGITVTMVRGDAQGRLAPEDFRNALTARTRLVVVNHASNVTGTISPLREIRAAIGETPLLVDGAQSVGALPIDVVADGIDMLAFSGHKALMGPQGVGVLCLRPGLDVEPLTVGGTGSNSESDEQPADLPDHYESGTPNGPGIAGLGAGVAFLLERGLEGIRRHEVALTRDLLHGLGQVEGVTICGNAGSDERVPVVSIRINGLTPSALAYRLDRRHGIMARAGLHCSPETHRTLGTYPEGTVRLSPGYLTTHEEIARTVAAVEQIRGELARAGA